MPIPTLLTRYLRKSARVGIGGKIRGKWSGCDRAVRFIVFKRYEVHGGGILSMNMWEITRERGGRA